MARIILLRAQPVDFVTDDKKTIKMLKLLGVGKGGLGTNDGLPVQDFSAPLEMMEQMRGKLPCLADVTFNVGGEGFKAKIIVEKFTFIEKIGLYGFTSKNIVSLSETAA